MKTKALQTLAVIGIATIALAGAATASTFTIYSTGFVTGSTSVEQSNKGVDGNYTIVEEASNTVLTSAYVTNNTGFPIVAGPWLADSSSSQWISPLASYAGGQASLPGVYGYQTQFSLSGLSSSVSAAINGQWAADNFFDGIYLNGILVPGTIGPPSTNEYTHLTSFVVSSGFVNGINTLDFYVNNGPGTSFNPTGVRTQLNGFYYVVPEPSPVMAVVVGIMGIGLLMIRRKRIS
jgi:hypothetical protein